MCGIVGIVGRERVAGDLISALRLLEYRGYDSAGIATVDGNRLDRRRAEGALRNLESVVDVTPIGGRIGIGHTRWATHGKPSERNAHPHATPRVSVVHNGIIENFRELRAELEANGANFESETDTEVIVHLVDGFLRAGDTPVTAVRRSLRRLRGAFAVAMIFAGHEDLLIAARRGSPLAIGHGSGRYFIGSDAVALAPFTDTVTYLEDGDLAVVLSSGLLIHDETDNEVARPVVKVPVTASTTSKGEHAHFMAKEIAEQPEALSRVLSHYFDFGRMAVREGAIGLDLAKYERLTISACGTAYYAGLVGKYWLERVAGIPVDIDVASEFRYREMPLSRSTLALFVSQSGETADTLAALRYCAAKGLDVASVVNVGTSTIARESSVALPIMAGPEIGVASTKAFVCQLAVMAALSIASATARGRLSRADEQALVGQLADLPEMMMEALDAAPMIKDVATQLAACRDVLFLGRGLYYPMALEGALKLKEISYIHAEGYAAGELKHGPIALVDGSVPVVVVAPKDELFEKTLSNMQEVAARGGRIIAISDAGRDEIGCDLAGYVPLASSCPLQAPFLSAVPLQLLAYHAALSLGRDVDKPRNLAKSVTVE